MTDAKCKSKMFFLHFVNYCKITVVCEKETFEISDNYEAKHKWKKIRKFTDVGRSKSYCETMATELTHNVSEEFK